MHGWRLHLVAVWSLSTAGYGFAPMTCVPYTGDLQREHGHDVLHAAVDAAGAAGVEASSQVRQGLAVEEICAEADKIGAVMIVIGAHGWGPVKRLVFGSVSTGVLHHASCPVLVVRGEPTKQKREEKLATTVSR